MALAGEVVDTLGARWGFAVPAIAVTVVALVVRLGRRTFREE